MPEQGTREPALSYAQVPKETYVSGKKGLLTLAYLTLKNSVRHLEPQIGEGEDVIPLYRHSNGLTMLRALMDDKQLRAQTHLESLSLAERKAAQAAMTQKLRQARILKASVSCSICCAKRPTYMAKET